MNKKIVIHIGKIGQKLSTAIHRQFTSNLNRMWKKIKGCPQCVKTPLFFCFFYINVLRWWVQFLDDDIKVAFKVFVCFKHFSDLAVAYFPQMASTSSASKKMRNCIKASNALSEQLADAHYTDTTIEISPEMQLIIYRHWGPPHIILSVKVQRVAENKNTDKK